MEISPDVITFVRDVGVPAAILLVVLLRIEPKLDKMREAVEGLTASVQVLVAIAARAPEWPRPGGEPK